MLIKHRGLVRISRGTQCSSDPTSRGVLLAVEALCVDPHKHVHIVAGPCGHLGCGHRRIEPQRHSGVPKVYAACRPVNAPEWACEHGRLRCARQLCTSCSAPADQASERTLHTDHGELQRAVRRARCKRADVLIKQAGQLRCHGHVPCRLAVAMFQTSSINGSPVIGPVVAHG
jgi:hypothetical protein